MSLTTTPFLNPDDSFFVSLGVSVDAPVDEIETAYRKLSRKFHPDRFATADPETQSEALVSTAILNDARRTLSDPFARAAYLLKIARGRTVDDLKAAQPSPDLFAQILDVQEALMEFSEARDDSDAATMDRLRPVLESARARMTALYDVYREQVADHLSSYAAGSTDPALDGIESVLALRGYIRRAVESLESALGASA